MRWRYKDIPKNDQLDNMFYCDKCPKSFKAKAYCWKHMTRLCLALTDMQRLKCPHCDKMYWHDKNYCEHLSLHDGIKRFKFEKCSEKFFTDMQVLKHRKFSIYYFNKIWLLANFCCIIATYMLKSQYIWHR